MSILIIFKYIQCYHSTANRILSVIGYKIFKYIQCYHSTQNWRRRHMHQGYSNTSNVIIQLDGLSWNQVAHRNSNTSNVIIQLIPENQKQSGCSIQIHPMLSFNSSNNRLPLLPLLIQIHPMLSFNIQKPYLCIDISNSNTSNVIIQHLPK